MLLCPGCVDPLMRKVTSASQSMQETLALKPARSHTPPFWHGELRHSSVSTPATLLALITSVCGRNREQAVRSSMGSLLALPTHQAQAGRCDPTVALPLPD